MANGLKSQQCAGFTLVEMSVVMVVIGLIIMTVFPALRALRSANQMSLTQSNLHSLMLATSAYVQANGCLPCPAIPGNAGTGTNFGRLGYATAAACGTCSAPQGIVPFGALGLPMSTAQDGWGHWITMRVDPALTSLPANTATCATTGTCSTFVPPTASCTAIDAANGFCLSASGSAKGFCAQNLSASAKAKPISVIVPGGGTQRAAVIFVSHGKTGYGSYFAGAKVNANNGYALPFPENYAACGISAGFAQCNSAGNNSTQFYDAPTVISETDPYDDVLVYADRNALVSMLGNGSCNTAW